ncbi:hypothetical protein NQ317_015195 [Molorchus minor]|uniref:Uncharacterized protein n=1 Tax=Molorchus minor TaxID=1323400 RepID=A0ABQ9JPU4_9CUCU|nr:hypothetical protein NQ317_015195 [Molorchus minor]
MSANMFTQTPTTNLQRAAESKTRIPIPASPTPLRRQGSLRTKGDSDATRRLSCGGSPAASKDNCRPGRFSGKYTQSAANPPLKRGYSFMERGEQRVGNGGSGSTVPRRPDTVKIDPRHLGTLKGPTTPQSPSRIRSLSLSLSNTRLQSSPKSPSAVTISPNNSIDHEARNYSTTHLDYWDSESVTSIDSSVASCEHASVARNGTTFSGRSMK